MTQVRKKIVNYKVFRLVGILFLIIQIRIVFAQSTLPISFQYKEPRHGRAESASYFLGDFAFRAKIPSLDCYSAMGSYRFHVARTGVIDSIAFTGDMHQELKRLGEKQIRESQQYWVCQNCEQSGGHWFTIPILISFNTAISCRDNPLFKQSVIFWDTLFKPIISEQLQVAANEWLLAPMYAVTMR